MLFCGSSKGTHYDHEAHRAATIPPTAAEWVEMSGRHLVTLRVAFVFANAPASKFDGLPAGSMGNVVTMLAPVKAAAASLLPQDSS